MRGITDTVKHLIIINILMFLGTLTIGNGVLFYELFALYFPKNPNFHFWQLVTHMFMHGSFQHILFNMFGLWMFGTAVEQIFGKGKFLFFYFSCGFGAAFLQLAYYYINYLPIEGELLTNGFTADQIIKMLSTNETIGFVADNQKMMLQELFPVFNSVMVGASGAIMGIFVAYGMLFPNSRLMLIFLPIPIKAKYFIPAIIAIDLFSALTGHSIFSPSNTAHVAHIGGALTGFIIMYFWKKNQFDKYRWN
jgi:membrane associated rhomboid family serine protease